jgi:hypothetical protein
LNNSLSHQPQIAQRKQRDQLCHVFDQAPIPSLAIVKLAFDHPEGGLHFGPNAGLDLLQFVDQGVYSFALLKSPALTRLHGKLPVSPRVLRFNLFALGDAAVTGVCEYNSLFTVQQSMRLRDLVLIGNSVRDRMTSQFKRLRQCVPSYRSANGCLSWSGASLFLNQKDQAVYK